MRPESYRAIMRHQAGAVTVVATASADRRAGLTATAVCSLSDTPPMLLACINRNAAAHDLILAERCFSVSLLASDQQDVAARFAGQAGVRGDARFTEHGWSRLATGAPVLDNALASLDCRLEDAHSFATHSIFIGRVVEGRVREGAEPLLYFRGDYWDLERR